MKNFLFLLIFAIHLGILRSFNDNQCIFPSEAYEENAAQQQFSWSRNETYLVVEIDNSTGAKCLDGSNYKFYYSAGHSSGEHKFMFFFESGGFCGYDGLSIGASCYRRCQMASRLCSSDDWGENNTDYIQTNPMGYFSSMQDHNPKFWNWNKIFISYCDGSNYQGYREDPYLYNDTLLWFRGYNNTISIFEYARTHLGLFNASEVFVAGASSGGQASFYWTAFLQNYLPKSVNLMGLSDSGFFIDIYNEMTNCSLLRYLMKEITNFTNSVQLDLFKNCRYANTQEIWKCLIPQYVSLDITVPFFIANSQEDYAAMSTLYGITCIAEGIETCSNLEKKHINKVREKFLKIILKLKKKKPDWGFWLRSCFDHAYFSSLAWYESGMEVFNGELEIESNLKGALYDWYNDGKILRNNHISYIDFLDSEYNPKCRLFLNNNS